MNDWLSQNCWPRETKRSRHSKEGKMWALPNKSFNLTPPALRGVRRSGAVKRAPQVNSNPLGCLTMDVGKREVRHRCAVGFLSILHAHRFGAVGSKKMEF